MQDQFDPDPDEEFYNTDEDHYLRNYDDGEEASETGEAPDVPEDPYLGLAAEDPNYNLPAEDPNYDVPNEKETTPTITIEQVYQAVEVIEQYCDEFDAIFRKKTHSLLGEDIVKLIKQRIATEVIKGVLNTIRIQLNDASE